MLERFANALGQWAMAVNGVWRICFVFRKGDAYGVDIVGYTEQSHTPIGHPGRLLGRELAARGLSANRLAHASAGRSAASRTS